MARNDSRSRSPSHRRRYSRSPLRSSRRTRRDRSRDPPYSSRSATIFLSLKQLFNNVGRIKSRFLYVRAGKLALGLYKEVHVRSFVISINCFTKLSALLHFIGTGRADLPRQGNTKGIEVAPCLLHLLSIRLPRRNRKQGQGNC